MSVSFHVVGTVLGQYRLGRRIGRGGMGEVYEADDLRLERRVALKILPPMLLTRPEVVRRFVQEAKSASALNHPHILSVYDIGEGSVGGNSVHYIAMELVEGSTLRDEIHWKRVPLKRLISTLAQAADALAKAHAHGIVHRDLKPDNIMVTGDGYAKIIDFGLAKLAEPRLSAGTPNSNTVTLTKEGGFLGTVGYMAPEQVEQKPAEYRSDIFSFGCILYEAVTRSRAFEGPSDVDVLYKILHEPPPLEKLDLGPVDLKRLITRCLEKSPEDRYQSMRDVALELRAIEPELSSPRQTPPSVEKSIESRHLSKMWAAAVAAFVVATITALIAVRQPATSQTPVMRALATWPSNEWNARISPDGAWVSFLSDRRGKTAIWVRRIKGGEPTLLADRPSEITDHLWSPDGDTIVYLSRTDGAFLQFIPAFGGPPGRSVRLPQELRDTLLVRWIGRNIYIEKIGALWRFDSETQQISKVANVTTKEGRARFIDVHKNEGKIAFSVYGADQVSLWLANLDGLNPVRLTDSGQRYSEYVPSFVGPDDQELVFSSTRSGQVDLWRMPVYGDSGSARQITFSPAIEWVEEVSRDGRTIAFSEDRDYSQLWLWDSASAQLNQLSAEAVRDLWPSAGAGSMIVFQRSKPLTDRQSHILDSNIFVSQLKNGRLTDPRLVVGDAGLPRIASDGRWLTYVKRGLPTRYELWVKDLRSEHQWRLTDRFRLSTLYKFPVDWLQSNVVWTPAADGLYFVEHADPNRQIIRHVNPATGDSRALVIGSEGVTFHDLNISADGRSLAYVRRSDGRSDVMVRDLRTGREIMRWMRAHDSWERVFCRGWRRSGELLVVHSFVDPEFNERIEAVQIKTDGREIISPLAARGFGGTARLDPVSDSVLFISTDSDGAHNVERVSLTDGRRRQLTNNKLPGISFSGLDILPDAKVLFALQESNSDLWLIDFPN